MNGTALDDAQTIERGIRLGGSTEIVANLEAALAEGPLTPDRIEHLAHPDWDRIELEERVNEPRPEDGDSVGLARLYGSEKTDAPGLAPTWALAASWYGWLPGAYASREAALLAYGYILGGENSGELEELRDQVARAEHRPITQADLTDFATR
ncbi:hypothetical protein [Streptomyces sp. NPDC004728]|uniref:hypothetical protein n=1 Tax=Streptomyces sp. NPDC004728 TaxID=3154289 RepID=UPI0033A0733A